ncbi:MAG: hypothetical protein J6K51_07105 [Clostridia bacterium]|nr:hypothetical protein [Clostridia bacterium]
MSKWFGMVLLFLFIAFPGVVKEGISSGLEKSFLVLMPALFPYMVVSQIFIKTGGASVFSRFLQVGNLSKKGVELLVPSLFCGYPTGARLSSFAYNNNEISKRELLLLFSFGNIPGFGFTVSYLGGVLFKSFRFGVMIYLSYLTASVLLCFLFSLSLPRQSTQSAPQQKCVSFGQALTEAVTESSLSMVSLICFVCFFSSLIHLLSTLRLPSALGVCLEAFLEITYGLESLAKFYGIMPTVFFAGFSGLCVLFQSLSFDQKNAVNLPLLFTARCLYGIVSVLIFCFLQLLAR